MSVKYNIDGKEVTFSEKEIDKIRQQHIKDGYVDHFVEDGKESIRCNLKGFLAYEMLKALVEGNNE